MISRLYIIISLYNYNYKYQILFSLWRTQFRSDFARELQGHGEDYSLNNSRRNSVALRRDLKLIKDKILHGSRLELGCLHRYARYKSPCSSRFNWIRRYALVINALDLHTSALRRHHCRVQPSWENRAERACFVNCLHEVSAERKSRLSRGAPERRGNALRMQTSIRREFASAPNYPRWIISVRLINDWAEFNRNKGRNYSRRAELGGSRPKPSQPFPVDIDID